MIALSNLSSQACQEKKLVWQAQKILRLLKIAPAVQLEIFLLGVQRMRQLNKKLRGKDKATTVLSFEAKGFIVAKSRFLGEVYLCPAAIERQGIPGKPEITEVNTRLIYYLVHGILHLKGYDHIGSPLAAKSMEKKEAEIFRQLSRK